jgi:hypothetical protein
MEVQRIRVRSNHTASQQSRAQECISRVIIIMPSYFCCDRPVQSTSKVFRAVLCGSHAVIISELQSAFDAHCNASVCCG